MSALEKHLIVIYTIIAIILIMFDLLILFRRELLKWSFVILLVFPMGCIGLFFMFVIIYSVADDIIKDNFVLTQIITNVFNFILIYRIFEDIKGRKYSKGGDAKKDSCNKE